jgi:hypothetical protein
MSKGWWDTQSPREVSYGVERCTPRLKGSGRAHTKEWKMKNGMRIRVCDMSDSHLRNTCKLIYRVVRVNHERAVVCSLEAVRFFSGEMAQVAVADEFLRLEEEGPEFPDILWDMVEELKQRGLRGPF